MNLISPAQAYGHQIALRTTDPRHLSGSSARAAAQAADPEGGFGKLFFQAMNQVNDLQARSQDLSQAMITDPDSVDIHDVTVALAEANLALSMTKAIIDRAIRAYREIVNIR